MTQAKAGGTSDWPCGQGGGNSADRITPGIRGGCLLPRRYLKSKRRGRDGLKDSRWLPQTSSGSLTIAEMNLNEQIVIVGTGGTIASRYDPARGRSVASQQV